MRIFPAIALLLLAAHQAPSQELAAPPDLKTKVDKVFARYASTATPGCAVGTSIVGDVSLQAAYGMADLEHNVPITPQTIFEPGSVTKQFTAAAVLLLVLRARFHSTIQSASTSPNYPTTVRPRSLCATF